MVPKGIQPYYEPCWQGFQDAGKKYGVKTEFRAPELFQLTQQVQVLEDLVSRHVTGITISAVDDTGLDNVVDQATKAGIKVITFDSAAPSTSALCYIGTSNEVAGYDAGVELAKLMDNKGQLAILQGGLGATNLNQRRAGLIKALKEKAPNIQVVGLSDTEGKIEEATKKTEDLLQANPNLRAIFGVSSECVPGAENVFKDKMKKGQLKKGQILLAGFDDQKETLDAIRAGDCQFSIAQKTYKMGWLSLEVLRAAHQGKPIPKNIDTGVELIRKDNVDTYMQDMKKEVQSLASGSFENATTTAATQAK